MTWSAVTKLGGGSDSLARNSDNTGTTSNQCEPAYVQVEGDFGKVILVTLKTVLHKLCQALLAVTKTSKVKLGLGAAETRIGLLVAAADITYYSPNVSGFQVGVSKDMQDLDANRK